MRNQIGVLKRKFENFKKKFFIGDTVVLYPTILPIVLLKTNPDLRVRFWRFFRVKKANKRNLEMVQENQCEMADHFKQLSEFWDLPETGISSRILKRKIYPALIHVRNI